MVGDNRKIVYLWAVAIGGLICGLPSMFFLFFHPLLILWGAVLGAGLGLLWAMLVLKLSNHSRWHFGVLGFTMGLLGTLIWGVYAWKYLKDIWVLILIANAFLILTTAGIIGSLIGKHQLEKAEVSPKSNVILACLAGFDSLFFILMPILKSLLME